ncbi:MAG: hypothetical protein K2L72_04150, partial [Clostridia bacterium]|nr:hypothetical protein [Clostridia bacterium]
MSANQVLIIIDTGVNTAMAARHCGANTAGVVGGSGSQLTLTMRNCIISSTADFNDLSGKKYTESGYLGHTPETGAFLALPRPTYQAGSSMTNVYFTHVATGYCYGSADNWFNNSTVSKTNVAVYSSFTPKNNLTNTPESQSNQTSTTAVNNLAKSNSAITSVLNTNSSGAVSGTKYEAGAAGATYYVNYVIGGLAGANQPATTSYTHGSSVALKNPTSVPTGTTFNNWRYGSVSGSAIANTSGRQGNLTVYATYKMDNSSVTHKNVGVDSNVYYGAVNQTISHTFSHPQITAGNATITDVKWYAPNGTQVVSGQNGIT